MANVREIVEAYGISPKDTIPLGVKVNDVIFSANLIGANLNTGKLAQGIEEQAERALQNMQTLLELVGATIDQVGRVTAFVTKVEDREVFYRPWDKMFPDPQDRPACKVLVAELPEEWLVQLEMLALVGEKRRSATMAVGDQVTELFPYPDLTPIPTGIKIGPVIYAPSITGRDPETGNLAEGFEGQLRLALQNMRATLERARATMANVAHVTVVMKDLSLRPTLNTVWVETFPDPTDRPPHIYVPAPLPGDLLVQLQMFALSGSRRQVLEIPGLAHQDPMSMGVKIANVIFSSRITAGAPSTGRSGEGAQEQADSVFNNVRRLLEQAGATPSNLTQVTAFVADSSARQVLTKPWQEMFPSEEGRPALHVVEWGQAGVRLEIMAAL